MGEIFDETYLLSYFKLKQTLNFENDASYINPNNTEIVNGEMKVALTSGVDTLKITRFIGTFDGDGYQIRGIKYNNSSSTGGYSLFGANSGTIKNLTITGNVIITQRSLKISGDMYTAGFASYNDGTIQNCINRLNITLNLEKDTVMCIGGIVANNRYTYDTDGITVLTGKIENCKNYGTITIGAPEEGLTINTITNDASKGIINCENYGAITRREPSNAITTTVSVGEIAGAMTETEQLNENTSSSENR